MSHEALALIAKEKKERTGRLDLITCELHPNNPLLQAVWGSLAELTHLTSLDLWESQISELAPLAKLKQLTSLYLHRNQISDLTPLAELKQLTSLYLGENQISDLTPLAGLKQLTGLDLSHNQITDLSPLLPLLQREAAPLKLVVWQSGQILNGEINVANNPLQTPPLEIVEQGPAAVLRWFEDIKKYGEGYLYEAKLLIVGEPSAGKTTLRKKLLDPRYRPPKEGEEKETLGVQIDKAWPFPYTEDVSKQFAANIWDFGGQDRQYPLHQFFLSGDSVYVLLSDDRKDNASLDKWFNMIRLLAGDKYKLLVLLNQINRSSKASNFDARKYEQQGFQFDCYELDLLNDAHRLEELTKSIQKALSELPQIGRSLPAYCSVVREALEKLPDDYITYERYEELCREIHKKQPQYDLDKSQQQKQALEYLRLVGSVVHYPNDSALSSIIILNPHWVIDAIYTVLTNKQIEEQGGRFTEDWLFKHWQSCSKPSGNSYSTSECQQLLRLMTRENFGICYAIKDEAKSHLVPLCMKEQLPPDAVFDEKGSLQHLFRYEIMPPGLVARLIVQLHEDIQAQWVCRKAVLLHNQTHGCTAKIEEYYLPNDANQYIRICVQGKAAERKIYLAILNKALLSVQKTWFKHLHYEEMIPCNCGECQAKSSLQLIAMSKIKLRLEKAKSDVGCPSGNDVPILPLLGGTYTLNIDKNIETIEELLAAIKSEKLGKEVAINLINVIGSDNIIGQHLRDANFTAHAKQHQGMNIKKVEIHGGQVTFAERVGKIKYQAGLGLDKKEVEALKVALQQLPEPAQQTLQQQLEAVAAAPEAERPRLLGEVRTFLLETGIAIGQNLSASALWEMLGMGFGV
jgi:internalin A